MTIRNTKLRENSFICIKCNKIYSLNLIRERQQKKKICSQCEKKRVTNEKRNQTKIKNSSSRKLETKTEESSNYDDSEIFNSNESVDDLGNNEDDYL